MPLIDQLLADIRNQLGQAVNLNLTRRSSACDVKSMRMSYFHPRRNLDPYQGQNEVSEQMAVRPGRGKR